MADNQFQPLDLVHLAPVEGPTREDIEAEYRIPSTNTLIRGEFVVESNDPERTYRQTAGSHIQALAWLRLLASQRRDLKFRVVEDKTGWRGYEDLPKDTSPALQALEDISEVLEGRVE